MKQVPLMDCQLKLLLDYQTNLLLNLDLSLAEIRIKSERIQRIFNLQEAE